MRIVTIIPARGGSKRIPRKNIKLLNGKPLIAYVIEASLKAYHFNGGVYVSTDDSEIKNISQRYGALVIDRPTELATDFSTTEEVIAHFLKQVPCDILVIIEATHPLISTADINGALTRFFKINCDSLVVLENKKILLWEHIDDTYARPLNYEPANRLRTQDSEGAYLENCGIYITTRAAFEQSKCRLSGKIGFYVVPHLCVDIDEELDFKIAEAILKEGGVSNNE